MLSQISLGILYTAIVKKTCASAGMYTALALKVFSKNVFFNRHRIIVVLSYSKKS